MPPASENSRTSHSETFGQRGFDHTCVNRCGRTEPQLTESFVGMCVNVDLSFVRMSLECFSQIKCMDLNLCSNAFTSFCRPERMRALFCGRGVVTFFFKLAPPLASWRKALRISTQGGCSRKLPRGGGGSVSRLRCQAEPGTGQNIVRVG